MAKTGRPRKNIDKTQFEKLCALQCTKKEIQAFFDVNSDTLSSWCKRTYGKTFEDAFDNYSQFGKLSLRRYQFRQAKKSSAMAIFLGKQVLGQKDCYDDNVNLQQVNVVNDVPKENDGNGE